MSQPSLSPLDELREAIGPLHAASSPKKRRGHAALADVQALVEAAREVSYCGVSFDDPRIEWVEVQVDREALVALRAALARFADIPGADQ